MPLRTIIADAYICKMQPFMSFQLVSCFRRAYKPLPEDATLADGIDLLPTSSGRCKHNS